jgi:hypothetical protein
MDASRLLSRLSISGVALIGGTTPGALVALDGSGLIANSFLHPTLTATGVSGDFTVAGNLTVNGTTTTVHSEAITIDDNIIVLNNNVTSGSPTENGGIQVRRGSSTSASILWDESTDTWKWGLAGSEVALQPLDGDLTSLAAASGTNTIYYRSATNTWSPVTIGAGLTFSGGNLVGTGGSFGSLSGSPSDNTALNTALNNKVNRTISAKSVLYSDSSGVVTYNNDILSFDENKQHLGIQVGHANSIQAAVHVISNFGDTVPGTSASITVDNSTTSVSQAVGIVSSVVLTNPNTTLTAPTSASASFNTGFSGYTADGKDFVYRIYAISGSTISQNSYDAATGADPNDSSTYSVDIGFSLPYGENIIIFRSLDGGATFTDYVILSGQSSGANSLRDDSTGWTAGEVTDFSVDTAAFVATGATFPITIYALGFGNDGTTYYLGAPVNLTVNDSSLAAAGQTYTIHATFETPDCVGFAISYNGTSYYIDNTAYTASSSLAVDINANFTGWTSGDVTSDYPGLANFEMPDSASYHAYLYKTFDGVRIYTAAPVNDSYNYNAGTLASIVFSCDPAYDSVRIIRTLGSNTGGIDFTITSGTLTFFDDGLRTWPTTTEHTTVSPTVRRQPAILAERFGAIDKDSAQIVIRNTDSDASAITGIKFTNDTDKNAYIYTTIGTNTAINLVSSDYITLATQSGVNYLYSTGEIQHTIAPTYTSFNQLQVGGLFNIYGGSAAPLFQINYNSNAASFGTPATPESGVLLKLKSSSLPLTICNTTGSAGIIVRDSSDTYNRITIQPTGTFIGTVGAANGAAKATYSCTGIVQTNSGFSTAASSTGGPVNVTDWTIQSNTFYSDKQCVEHEIYGRFAANNNSKVIGFNLNGTTMNFTATSANNKTFIMKLKLVRKNSTTMWAWGELNVSGSTTEILREVTSAFGASSTYRVKTVLSTATASNDTLIDYIETIWKPV